MIIRIYKTMQAKPTVFVVTISYVPHTLKPIYCLHSARPSRGATIRNPRTAFSQVHDALRCFAGFGQPINFVKERIKYNAKQQHRMEKALRNFIAHSSAGQVV